MLVSDCRLDADTANLACSCCECGWVDKSMKRNNVPDERKSDCIGKCTELLQPRLSITFSGNHLQPRLSITFCNLTFCNLFLALFLSIPAEKYFKHPDDVRALHQPCAARR